MENTGRLKYGHGDYGPSVSQVKEPYPPNRYLLVIRLIVDEVFRSTAVNAILNECGIGGSEAVVFSTNHKASRVNDSSNNRTSFRLG